LSVGPIEARPTELSTPEQDGTRWQVHPGDTLGGIARQLAREGMPGTIAELVRTLARLNGIENPDRIEVGQVLTLPGPGVAPPPSQDTIVTAAAAPRRSPRVAVLDAVGRQGLLHGALLRLTRGRNAPAEPGHPRAPDGTPLFRQGDPAWRAERLGVSGEGPTLAHAGCAVTACAMALSRLGGTVLTPDALLRHLREWGGFKGPLVDWSAAGAAVKGAPRACPGPLDPAALDRELDAGRPVLLRVVHEVTGGPQQHWICLTGRDGPTGQYTANDPATGRTTVLVRRDGALVSAGGEPIHYTADGRMVRFSTDPAQQA